MMSEEAAVSYKHGDIVWVKLGPCWWPAEVTEQFPEDLNSSFRKTPLVVVKFFDEDSYEYIRSFANIYSYNCDRKNEFIKKGMDSFRANNVHMEKFPVDVSLAELKTDGNPNIISDPMFAPQKKSTIVAEVFGPAKPKKRDVKEPGSPTKGRRSTIKRPGKQKSKSHVTHRRFVGYDDYESHVRIQTVCKENGHDEDTVRFNAEPTDMFPCSTCSFKTNRLEVMFLHVSCHAKGLISTAPPVKKKAQSKKIRKPKIPKAVLSDDDSTTVSTPQTDEDSVKPKPKKKKRVPKELGEDTQKKTDEEQKSLVDIRSNLLAEWSDSDEDDDDTGINKLNSSNDSIENDSIIEEEPATKSSEIEDKPDEVNTKDLSKSCFDFEEEEEDNSIVHTAVGRKIPRVIPPSEKRRSSDPDNEDANLPLAEDDENRMEILKVSENLNENSNSEEPDEVLAKDESIFKDLMESMSVPELPDVPEKLKCTQNFPSAKTIKFPDKTKTEPVTEVATKLTNPKKRFVKSFEDFELLQNEQRKAMEEKELNEKAEEAKKQEVPVVTEQIAKPTEEKETSQITEEAKKQEALVVAQVVLETNTVDVIKKVTDVKSPVKGSKMKVATKSPVKEDKAKTDDLLKLETNLKISKLKTQIMTKLGDEDAKAAEAKNTVATRTRSHRTPRSKILESYRNDTAAVVDSEQKEESAVVDSKQKEKSAAVVDKQKEESAVVVDIKQKEENDHVVEEPEIKETVEEEGKDVLATSEQKEEEATKILEPPPALPDKKETSRKRSFDETAGKTTKKDSYTSKKSKYFKFSAHEEKKVEEPKDAEATIDDAKIDQIVEETLAIGPSSSVQEATSVSETIDTELLEKEVKKQVEPIDDYLDDFLLDFNKKSDVLKDDDVDSASSKEEASPLPEIAESKPTEDIEVETVPSSEEIEVETVANNEEIEVETGPSSEEASEVDVAIKSSLTNLTKIEDDEELSGLSTLAAVSELKTTIESNTSPADEPAISIAVSPKLSFEEQFFTKPPTSTTESEMVPIDGNLTVVSEKDLADGQVEITANVSSPNKKPVTLTSFSMDFSECNSNSDSTTSFQDEDKKEDKQPDKPTENIKSEKKQTISASKPTVVDELCDVEEHIPSQIVCAQDPAKLKKDDKKALPVLPETSGSKLLERLIEGKIGKDITATPKHFKIQSPQSSDSKVPVTVAKDTSSPPITAFNSKNSKFVIKSATVTTKGVKVTTPTSKPIILSEKIIKPDDTIPTKSSGSVSVQKITSKRSMQDADEIDTFIIQKGAKAAEDEESSNSSMDYADEFMLHRGKKRPANSEPKKQDTTPAKKRGKAKILQQTIITPAGEIIQPAAAAAQTTDENVFDINSMPIVLSDQILTPENIESMPILLSDQPAEQVTPKTTPTLTKKIPPPPPPMRILNKSMTPSSTVVGTIIDKSTPKIITKTTSKILTGVSTKIIKQNSFSPGSSSKQGKYVIVSQPSTSTTPSKYTVGKKQTIIKRPANEIGTLTKVQNMASEPSGNKIMILTNQQGQQQRVLLTPAQQKLMGYQNQGKATKTIVKGNIIHKTKDGQMTAVPGSSGLISKNVIAHSPASQRIAAGQTLISSTGQVITPVHGSTPTGKTIRIEKTIPGRKLQMQSQKVSINRPPQKTILIKNQHGQTVRKIQGTDDALLDKQVAEQIEAIKASGGLHQKSDHLNYKSTPRTFRRSYSKKPTDSPKLMTKSQLVVTSTSQVVNKTDNTVPPLAPFSPKKSETVAQEKPATETKPERPLNQLVIQDAMGNQTTITEGQILALPSETIDGQPQSYMLVTLDESGNLTPLNNEALMSLDPNLGLGGDLGNTVLQIDQSALKDEVVAPVQPEPPSQKTETAAQELPKTAVEETVQTPPPTDITAQQQTSAAVAGGDTGQPQLIVTGDPIAAQKFLESLTEGNPDLAKILASAEGSSFLIHADGQQILINADSDNQMLLSVNTDNLSIAESTEGGGNPIFATQPSKNQDILAAALADTDVFQQEQNSAQSKVIQSQLSPSSTLYPMNVGNVLETSLTLNSPIMTPLEVPSTNSKKISDESDILQVPKNVDLPITITDPNISQTVAQQQVLMNSELQSNLELSLPISESISVTSTEMNSPSFVYSLPSLDESVDISQKPFNSSMPLLTEDTEDAPATDIKDKNEITVETTMPEAVVETDAKTEPETMSPPNEFLAGDHDKTEPESKTIPTSTFLDETEGLCTLGGEMCSSLSEPPPDMFDLSAVLNAQIKQSEAEDMPQAKDCKADEPPKIIDNNGLEDVDLKIDTTEDGDKASVLTDLSSDSANPDTTSTVTETSSPNSLNEDSCEIPVQPEIVTTLTDDQFGGGGEMDARKRRTPDADETDSKRCKFD